MNGKSMTFFWKTVETVGSMGATLFLNLCTGVLISRGLGPQDKGIYVGTTAWLVILQWVFNISFYQVTVYYFGKHQDERGRRVIFTTFLYASIGFGVLACIVGELFVIPLLIHRGFGSDINVMRLLFSILPLATAFQVVNGGLNGSMRFKLTNAVRVLQPLALVAVWSYLYFSHKMTVTSCLYWYIVLSTAFAVVSLAHTIRLGFCGGRIDIDIFKEGFFYGLKAHGATVADVANGNLTPILLSVMLPASYLGIFSTAQSASGTLNALSMAVVMTGFPVLSSIPSDETHAATMRMWRATLFATVPAAVMLVTVLPLAIPLFYGKQFGAAIPCAVILIFSVVLSGQSGILRNALNSRGYTLINSTSEAIALVSSVSGMLVFPRFFGMEGAALAVVLGAIVRITALMFTYSSKIQAATIVELVPGNAELSYFLGVFAGFKTRAFRRIKL